MVVYDVTSDQSIDSCAKWLERVKAQKPTPELPLPSEHNYELSLRTKFLFKKNMYAYVGVLVANKIDLDKRRVVSEAQGRKFAASKELEYFECSAVSEKHHFHIKYMYIGI